MFLMFSPYLISSLSPLEAVTIVMKASFTTQTQTAPRKSLLWKRGGGGVIGFVTIIPQIPWLVSSPRFQNLYYQPLFTMSATALSVPIIHTSCSIPYKIRNLNLSRWNEGLSLVSFHSGIWNSILWISCFLRHQPKVAWSTSTCGISAWVQENTRTDRWTGQMEIINEPHLMLSVSIRFRETMA